MLSRGSPGFYFTFCLFSFTKYNTSCIIILFQVSNVFEDIRNLNPKLVSIAKKSYFTKDSILSDSFFYRKQNFRS